MIVHGATNVSRLFALLTQDKIHTIGDILGISGILFRTKTDQLSIKVSSLTLLSKNIYPLPNMKEKDEYNEIKWDNIKP